jgi:hypothetical protein
MRHSFLLVGNLLNLPLLLIVFTHQSVDADIAGRYSRSYALAIGAALVVVLLVFLFTWKGQARLATVLKRVPNSVKIGIPLIFLALMTGLWMLPVDAREVMLLITFNAICLGVWMVTSTSATGELAQNRSDPAFSSPRRWQFLLIGILIALLAIGFFSARSVPIIQSSGDEPAWTDYAMSWLDTGEIYYRIAAKPPVQIAPGIGYWLIPYAAWMQVFGVTFASGRLFIWTIYAVLVLTITAVGWRLYDRWVGLLAGIIAASSTYVLHTRIIRPEIGLPIFGTLLILIYLREKPLWALLAGWLVVFSLEVHAAGLAYIVGGAGLYVSDLFLRRDNPRRYLRLFLFLVGLALGVLVYIAFHILSLPDPSFYFSTLRAERGFLGGFVLDSLVLSFGLYWLRAPLELFVILLSLIGLVLRRAPGDRLLLRYLAFCAFGYFVFVPGFERYLLVFTPFVALGFAALVRYAFERRGSSSTPQFVGSVTAALCFCAPYLALSLPGIRGDVLAAEPMPPFVSHVRQFADQSSVVAGNINTYWWFRDYAGFYANNSDFSNSLIATLPADDPRSPDVIFFTPTPSMPALPASVVEWLNAREYRLIDTFESDGATTRIWRRPGYQ